MIARNLSQVSGLLTGLLLFQQHGPLQFQPEVHVNARLQGLGQQGPGDRKPGDRYRLRGAVLGLIIGSLVGVLTGYLFFGVTGTVLGCIGGAVLGTFVGTRLGYVIWKRKTAGKSRSHPPDDSDLVT